MRSCCPTAFYVARPRSRSSPRSSSSTHPQLRARWATGRGAAVGARPTASPRNGGHPAPRLSTRPLPAVDGRPRSPGGRTLTSPSRPAHGGRAARPRPSSPMARSATAAERLADFLDAWRRPAGLGPRWRSRPCVVLEFVPRGPGGLDYAVEVRARYSDVLTGDRSGRSASRQVTAAEYRGRRSRRSRLAYHGCTTSGRRRLVAHAHCDDATALVEPSRGRTSCGLWSSTCARRDMQFMRAPTQSDVPPRPRRPSCALAIRR